MKPQSMIDIETLSSQPDAAIIAIGICIFDEEEILDHQEILIDPQLAPGHRDPKTIDWWNEQEQGTRQRMMSGTVKPWDACLGIIDFFDQNPGVKTMWANPPSFDIIILRYLFRLYDRPFPIHYTGERDFRTIKKMAEEVGVDYSEPYDERRFAHDAVDDAITQARALQIMLRDLALL